eukprot:CAMPEP_0177764826 /NCGR_PEP_ID=MMETSP0491_2-20121128/7629_1 /TAXON_ID=63592 /ORGANISM="Tetraselmis chuii, Strain PLY429" /LENGTH=95 /DNA_ID=CAMNT_0019281061 /DNA_START=243 /DNA_END=530 /DNA_ORIENTATION=-
MFGKQTDARKRSEPSVSFSKTTRDKVANQFLTIKHTKTDMLCRTGPGPIYDPQGAKSLGKQTLSSNKSMPSYGFGKERRMYVKVEESPGPGAYDN